MGPTTERRPMTLTNRVSNPAVRLLFRTPARGLVDRSVVLLRVTGRRSGKTYTFPAQYARDGDVLWILVGNHERKTWWRNLRERAPVHVRCRDLDTDATARAVVGDQDHELTADGVAAFVRRWPAAASHVADPTTVVLVRV